MNTSTDHLEPAGRVHELAHPWGADVERREPPGEAFPPVNPLVGDENPDADLAHWLHAHSALLADTRTYLALLAQRTAPVNEQIFEGGGTAAASLLDVDLGILKPHLVTRLHRVVIAGTPTDAVTVSLHLDAVTPGAALAQFAFGAALSGRPVLDADGIGMAEPSDLHVPPGRRLIARVRPTTATSGIYLRVFGRSYPA